MLIKRRDQPKVEANKFLDCGCWSIWGGLTIWTSHYIGTSTSRRPSWIFLQTPRTPQPRRSISGTSKVGKIIDPKEGFLVSGNWVRPHILQLFHWGKLWTWWHCYSFRRNSRGTWHGAPVSHHRGVQMRAPPPYILQRSLVFLSHIAGIAMETGWKWPIYRWFAYETWRCSRRLWDKNLPKGNP